MRTLPFAALAICLCTTAPFHELGMHPSEKKNMQHASGPFEVKVTPQKDEPADPSLGRMTLDKHYLGDLEATSFGQMLYGYGTVEGSGAAVVIEKITGTLRGRKGSFILYHTGTMQGGKYDMTSNVVPDSGTGELVGLTGQLKIIIAADGKHSYQFDYSLPAAN